MRNNVTISDIDISVSRKISEQKAVNLKVIPFKEDDATVYILIDKYKQDIVDEIEFIFRKKVIEKVISVEEIEYFLKIIYLGKRDNVEEVVLKEAIKLKASDIHFEPNRNFVIVRFRIDGLLRVKYLFDTKEYQAILSKIKVNSNLDITDKRKPQDGKMTFEYKLKSYDLRISIIPIVYGEKVVIRILYSDIFTYSLEELRLTESQINKLKYIMKVNTGLVIVNGVTGSGKSTTLYCMLQELNKNEINISTLEDPIEAIIPGINQMALNRSLKIGFAEGLRSLLRQDPDIMMLGEIRDEETAEMAVRAALTGHKVYSTIHTRDPREVYFRLSDMGVEDYLIRDSLVGIISQRLVRLLCNSCKNYIGDKFILNSKLKLYEKCGCKECNYTGYKGRALVASINIIDKNTKKSIKGIYENRDILTNFEMIENLNELLRLGEIAFDDYVNFIEMEEIDYNYEKQSEL